MRSIIAQWNCFFHPSQLNLTKINLNLLTGALTVPLEHDKAKSWGPHWVISPYCGMGS